MIALSQSAPLHVIVSTSKLPLARPFIEPVGFRISELDIFVDDNFAPGSVGMEGAMETHVEESLLASISLHALFMLRIFSTKDAFISKGIPWKGLTSLRFLQLAHILPMDELPELPRLTNLHINSLLGVELRWLLRALVNFQSIQCVDVSHVSSAHPEDAALSSFQAILLPKLDKLKIVTTTLAAFKLFDYIRPPRSAVIEAKYVNPRSDDASPLTYLSSLKNFIRSHYRGSSSRTQMLRISARKHPSVRVFVDISLGALDRPLLSLSFTTDNLETSDYVALLSALPLSNIRELALTTQVTDFALHTSVLPLCTRLHTMISDEGSLRSLHSYFCDGNNKSFNPKLSAFGIDNVAFSHDGRDHENENDQLLVDILEERQRTPLPVQVVILSACTLSQASLERLKKLVPIVWMSDQEL
ncbi:hypothetical protein ONZ45_g16127 [Pleurotus djamor]|nr:hypothetical protein ONZ45_g16127 [Pleurotus djamor]